MKWYIPREHGAWSLWLTPFMIGMIISPRNWLMVAAFIAILFLYLSTAPLLALVRKKYKEGSPLPSLAIFLGIGLLFMSIPFSANPKISVYALIVVPMFLLNVYFARQKKERLMLNDIAALIALSSVSLFVVHIGYGDFHYDGLTVWLLSIAFFTGTVFYVKSLIRERNNKKYKIAGNLYYALIVGVPMIMGSFWISAIFLPAALKAWVTPFQYVMRPITIGIIEIINSVVFLVLVVFLIK